MIVANETGGGSQCAVANEQRLLYAGWFNPIELNNTAFLLGLRSDDFIVEGHGFAFCYLCNVAELGLTPTIDECVALAAENGVADMQSILDGVLFGTVAPIEHLPDYAGEVLRASQQRSEAELVAVARALRARLECSNNLRK